MMMTTTRGGGGDGGAVLWLAREIHTQYDHDGLLPLI